jgi:hypothetical protein
LQRRLPNVEGQKFTPASKQQLMEGLAVAIQAREVSFPEGPITAELLAFQYHYSRTGVRYPAPEGMHDDCVDAMAVRQRTRPSNRVGPGVCVEAGGGAAAVLLELALTTAPTSTTHRRHSGILEWPSMVKAPSEKEVSTWNTSSKNS